MNAEQPRLLDLPAPALARIVAMLAELGAMHLLQLRLTCRAGPKLAEDAARLAVGRRGDAEKSPRSPSGDGRCEWLRLLHELQLLAAPVFTRATPDVDIRFPSRYSFPRGTAGSQAVSVTGRFGMAICDAVPMSVGVHYAEFTVAELGPRAEMELGVVPADRIEQSQWVLPNGDVGPDAYRDGTFAGQVGWMYDCAEGALRHDGTLERWAGQDEASAGDVVGLLLDLRGAAAEGGGGEGGGGGGGGTLSVYQDGERLGMMVMASDRGGGGGGGGGLKPPLYWCVALYGDSVASANGGAPARVWIEGKPAPEVTAADLEEDERKHEVMRERAERHALGEYSDDDSDEEEDDVLPFPPPPQIVDVT
jgi:hypothetical protein